MRGDNADGERPNGKGRLDWCPGCRGELRDDITPHYSNKVPVQGIYRGYITALVGRFLLQSRGFSLYGR